MANVQSLVYSNCTLISFCILTDFFLTFIFVSPNSYRSVEHIWEFDLVKEFPFYFKHIYIFIKYKTGALRRISVIGESVFIQNTKVFSIGYWDILDSDITSI
jgi:hypothetical protein